MLVKKERSYLLLGANQAHFLMRNQSLIPRSRWEQDWIISWSNSLSGARLITWESRPLHCPYITTSQSHWGDSPTYPEMSWSTARQRRVPREGRQLIFNNPKIMKEQWHLFSQRNMKIKLSFPLCIYSRFP